MQVNKLFLIAVICAAIYFIREKNLIENNEIFTDKKNETRGVLNKNPLNIEYSINNDWLGQTGSDGRFCTFSDPIYGIRAGAVLLRNYINLYGLNTIELIINRFAPNHENPTSNYVKYVANNAKINKNQPLIISDIRKIIPYMIFFENGYNPYSNSQFNEAFKLAGI